MIAAMLMIAITAAAQYTKPYYLPGEGTYLVGMPSNMQPVVTEPTMVTQAYQAKFTLHNADLASITAGTKTYNLASYIEEENTLLNLTRFMGVGETKSLKVRDFNFNAYEIGDNAPNKTWDAAHLIAAYPDYNGKRYLPLCVYDQWDCPISYGKDSHLGQGHADAIRVDFGNPHEGLVAKNINFPLVVAAGCDLSKLLTVTLKIYNERGTEVVDEVSENFCLSTLTKVAEKPEGDVYSVVMTLAGSKMPGIILNTRFTVTISGFDQDGVDAWLPQAIDTHDIYPSHTEYLTNAIATTYPMTDAVVNIDGYFNYIGTWGWYDGKSERGEVVGTADLVQVYYDPTDPDWPGDYFKGEASFPVECTFGEKDITIDEMPDWINTIQTDPSQWEEHGAIQLILSADGLPEGETGRNGHVVFCTADGASRYTIYIRQGNAWFEDITGIAAPVVSLPAAGGYFDLQGRRISHPVSGSLYIYNGKKIIK